MIFSHACGSIGVRYSILCLYEKIQTSVVRVLMMEDV